MPSQTLKFAAILLCLPYRDTCKRVHTLLLKVLLDKHVCMCLHNVIFIHTHIKYTHCIYLTLCMLTLVHSGRHMHSLTVDACKCVHNVFA